MAESDNEIKHIKKLVEKPVKFKIESKEITPGSEREQKIAGQPYGYPVDQEIEKSRAKQEEIQKRGSESPDMERIKKQMIKNGTYSGGGSINAARESGEGQDEKKLEENKENKEEKTAEEPEEETENSSKGGGFKAAGDFAKRTVDGIKNALSKVKFKVAGIPVNLWDILLVIGTVLIWIGILACFAIMLVACTGTCGKKNTVSTNIVKDNSLINCLLANTGDKEAFARCVSGNSQSQLDMLKSIKDQAPEKAKPIIDKLIDKFQQLINAQAKGENTSDIINEIYALTLELKKYYPDIGPATTDLGSVNKPIGKIVINKAELRADFYDASGKKMGSAPINIGLTGRDTPVGNFTVGSKEENLNGYIPSSIYNTSIGHEWIQFSGNYGFHGDIDENQQSLRPTYGCIRMYNNDLKWIYPYAESGKTQVEIKN